MRKDNNNMVAFVNPAESPRRSRREVDNMSLESDLESVEVAMHSLFEAAVELDSFLHEKNGENSIADDSSFASEERRLHESEIELRTTLDAIDAQDDSEETDSVDDDDPSFSCDPLDAFSAESYESPESQVPLLQPVSPFGSPISERSTSSALKVACLPSPALLKEVSPVIAPIIPSPSESSSKKRQIRAYGLRPHVEDSFVDLEASLEKFSPKNGSSAQIMANALFGRTEYTVRPLLARNGEFYKRTVQGTISVMLTTGIVAADRAKNLGVLAVLLPLLVAVIQAKLPHKTDETIIAVVILATHVTLSHLTALQAI